MNPFFVVAVVAAFASFTNQPASAQISANQYATLMASMSACGLMIDTAKMGQLMVASGIDPKTQEQAEVLGKLMWEESQRVFTMSNAEQAAHCQRMRQAVGQLGL